MQRIKPQHKYRLPGRLKKPESKQSKRRIARITAIARPCAMQRGRNLKFVLSSAELLGFDLYGWLARTAHQYQMGRRKIPIKALEIGCGSGYALRDLKSRLYGNAVTCGIDIIKEELVGDSVDEYRKGDALKIPFPKADLIFSYFTLGYVGHPNVIVEKTAAALKASGIAVLHFNTRGTIGMRENVQLLQGSAKYFEWLKESGKTKTPGTHVRVKLDVPPMGSAECRDWFVLIRKTK